MTHLSHHTFLLSMKEEQENINVSEGRKDLLQEQQDKFKEFLSEHCGLEMPPSERYEFLTKADYEICSIRLMHTDKIKESGMEYYRFWALLLADTRRFIKAGLNSLEFQATCPPYLLKEAATFPTYEWKGSRADLTELLTGIYCADVIRLKNGKRPSFVPFAQFFGNFFGIEYKYPGDEMRKILTRKRDPAPFFHRIIESLKEKEANN
jgi:hypothetical protein